MLATAALDLDALNARIDAARAGRAAFVTRVERAHAERPCQACGAAPTVLFPRGRLCASCAPPQPTRGYCAPLRCYCPTDSCQRPA